MDFSQPQKPDVAQIAERITDAVMEHRLPPGIKLVEEKLATAFGVSRAKIRQALSLLAKEGLVTLHANRGAFVTRPTAAEARDLFATRRLIEPEIVRNVIERASDEDLKRLQAHLTEEADARQQGNRRRIIRLSGQFHMLLAQASGNKFIEKMMSELCPLTCLIIALYDEPQTPACPEDEHSQIIEAITRKDTDRAIQLMLNHLEHIEKELHLDRPAARDIQWETLYG
ncbi:GntR family transcriptional regulator [Marinobacter zhejiangensis]|uniref:DNA-binding transcriptional regulator, GntR family n=1 Tax=Marinobacter zhejiangensis TaxID=488535 RepID=A0A1I4NSZ8_9GAMM|nr:GntR family transcriptional regulator [Marinobacter zhejiangensis]SFM18621.1 DNA-binding transcriptional regulator, GntR family [Marinobacter zhejiangensis]